MNVATGIPNSKATMVCALVVALVAVCLLPAASPAQIVPFEPIYVVNATSDDTDASLADNICDADASTAGEQCTLRAAIQQANFGAGGAQITLPAGAYTLTRPEYSVVPAGDYVGDLNIYDDLTITGGGARTTRVIGGEGFDDAIFSNEGEATTAISDLTVTGGRVSGVNNFSGRLTLNRVAVTANISGQFIGGDLSSGGITSFEPLSITDSTVSGNRAISGAGITQIGDAANITNSTVSGNRSAGAFGGVLAEDATVNIRSSTIANNSSDRPGGGIGVSGTSGTVNAKNTIVSGNSPTNCASSSGAAVTSQGNNLDSASSCGFAQSTDKRNTDPRLGPLANNDGLTDTHALLSGSPAIDSGNSDQTDDQRGIARSQNGDNDASAVDDIGAFERRDVSPPRVTVTSPAAGATGVRRAANLGATFSETMDQATLDKTTFKLYRLGAGGTATPVADVTVGSTADGLRATLNPFGTTSTMLAANTRYRAVVIAGARDFAGNGLDQNRAVSGDQAMVWTFTTGSV